MTDALALIPPLSVLHNEESKCIVLLTVFLFFHRSITFGKATTKEIPTLWPDLSSKVNGKAHGDREMSRRGSLE
jgi:hypothetical protein